MEKRVFIAVLLSLLVLIIYQKLLLDSSPEVPPGEASYEKESLPNELLKEGFSQEKPSRVVPVELNKTLGDKEIIVTTDLYRAIFSSRGARLKSWKLNQYLTELKEAGEGVDLVTRTAAGKATSLFRLRFVNSLDDQEIFFQTNEDDINLTDKNNGSTLSFFALTKEGIKIEKNYFFNPDNYSIDLDFTITNFSSQPVKGKLELVWNSWEGQEGGKDHFGFKGPVVFANNKLEEIPVKKLKEERIFSGDLGWTGFEEKYFLSAIIPRNHKGILKLNRLGSVASATFLYPDMRIFPKEQINYQYTVYLGPKDITRLREVDSSLENALNFGWFDFIAKPLLFALNFLNNYTHNYGAAIIILTVLIKILLFPLTHKSYKSMKDMQKVQPQLAKLREKYKDDREGLNREIMELYRVNKINPLGGCLPMVLQIPVFFAFYKVLYSSIEIRHSPFMWWINDLSAPDTAFYIGSFPANILPVLMGITMFIQQKMTPTASADPIQAKLMLFMPLIFLVILWNLPSGLVLYWTITNVLSIAQQAYINKH